MSRTLSMLFFVRSLKAYVVQLSSFVLWLVAGAWTFSGILNMFPQLPIQTDKVLSSNAERFPKFAVFIERASFLREASKFVGHHTPKAYYVVILMNRRHV